MNLSSALIAALLAAGTIAPVHAADALSGAYLGATAGYARGNHDTELLDDDHESKGTLFGLQGGYSVVSGQWLYGVEGDYSWSGMDSDEIVSGATPVGGNSTVRIRHAIDDLATLRGRVGYVADGFMPYLTGGLAFGNVSSRADATISGLPAPYTALNGNFSGSHDESHQGWVIGVGIETTFSARWSANIEFLHVDLGEEKYLALPQLDPVERSHEITKDMVRVGINYHF